MTEPADEVARNPDLGTLRPEYPGNRLSRGRFVSRYTSWSGTSFGPVLRWKFSRNPKREAKRLDTFALEVRQVEQLPALDRDWVLWLGHASFLIRVQGRTLLTDPCLTAPPFMKRLSALPLDIRTVPIDYVILSHGHFDHLDQRTLAMLQGPALTALAPLRLKPLIVAANPRMVVQEAGWYQVFDTPSDLRITLLPAHHWNRRGLNDRNRTLWGSFHVRWGGKSLYFAGDTGYHEHFKAAAGLMGPVDLALLPIGAYDPAFIMRASHMNPEEALQAFQDLEGRRMVPMHFGTFDLSDEPLGEPLERLREGAQRLGLEDMVCPLAVGEPLYL
jgi:L-ascorbate metabolism protein UlaG (beta-lactamase superfamily)